MYANNQKKIRRKPTVAAVLVGTICFLFSIGIVGGLGILLFPYAKQYMNKTVFVIIASIGALPSTFIVMWLTVFFMETIEKLFGFQFRTKSGIEKDR